MEDVLKQIGLNSRSMEWKSFFTLTRVITFYQTDRGDGSEER